MPQIIYPTRNDVLSEASDKCMKSLYSLAQPEIKWKDFVKECKKYSEKYMEWESIKENRPNITEFCGPRPYEFYYLSSEVMKEVCDGYIDAYKIDSQKELLDTIEVLKKYCKEPIVDKWIEGKNGEPGYRGYDRPDNLVKQLTNLIPDSGFDKSVIAESVQNKFFEFLDMAGNFFCWNRDLNTFNTKVYLGCSPSSNKEGVIENWKKYRNKDIEINELKYKENDDDF